MDELSGAFTHTPDPEFAARGGEDSFTVVATDNRLHLLKLFKPFNGDPVTTINLNVIGTSVRGEAVYRGCIRVHRHADRHRTGRAEPGERDFTRRVHILLSAMWGVGLLFGLSIGLAIIFSLSTDVGKGVNTRVSLALTGLRRRRWPRMREPGGRPSRNKRPLQ